MLLQAQHDYLQGNYPVVRDDAAQMCALQMQAECGPNLLDTPDALDAAIEKYVVKQVHTLPFYICLPNQVFYSTTFKPRNHVTWKVDRWGDVPDVRL